MTGIAKLFRRQNAHSLYLSCAALLFSLTLVVDLVHHRDMENQWLLWVLLVFCLAGGVTAFRFGARVPKWVGITSVFVFVASQSYYLSLRDDPQAVVSSVQSLPIVAFYLGWFVRPGVDYVLMAVCLLVFGIAMGTNPALGPEGVIGVPVAVHGILSLLFCFIAGAYLWRRTEQQATIDPLTGAVNRQAILERIEYQLRRSRTRGPLCLVAIDFDDFKILNDEQGHAAGDAALRDTVAMWRSGSRTQDVVARIGGDEFVMLLPRTSEAEAQTLVARLQADGLHAWSWGIAQSRREDTAATLLARADNELFEQKRLKRRTRRG